MFAGNAGARRLARGRERLARSGGVGVARARGGRSSVQDRPAWRESVGAADRPPRPGPRASRPLRGVGVARASGGRSPVQDRDARVKRKGERAGEGAGAPSACAPTRLVMVKRVTTCRRPTPGRWRDREVEARRRCVRSGRDARGPRRGRICGAKRGRICGARRERTRGLERVAYPRGWSSGRRTVPSASTTGRRNAKRSRVRT